MDAPDDDDGVHRRTVRRLVVLVVSSAALIAGAAWGLAHVDVAGGVAARAAAEAGARAFDGRAPLVARIDGHAQPLPAAAVACTNCHLPSRTPPSPDGRAAPAASLGPVLHRDALVGPAPRRGGPPSRFDETAFCRLLRTGEDPAGVLLPRAMPRYEIDDAGCGQLWRHLMRTHG
jgi:hypothetical protein